MEKMKEVNRKLVKRIELMEEEILIKEGMEESGKEIGEKKEEEMNTVRGDFKRMCVREKESWAEQVEMEMELEERKEWKERCKKRKMR